MSIFESLYVHVPFCNGKCDYCAFYSIGYHTIEQQRSYLKRILQDFRQYAPACAPLRSIFLGGGTPTALFPDILDTLLAAIHSSFTLAPDCEFTSESTPDSLTDETIAILAKHHVNRISIGVQSFIPEERCAIGRRGTLDNLPHIVETLKAYGIRNINFDLMFLLPGQTPKSFQKSLEHALAFEPTHLSAYALTLEEKSPLAHRLKDVDDTLFHEYWNTLDTTLAPNGLERYEISNFAQNGKCCRHNQDVWHGGTYLGCGPAATSFDGTDRFTQPSSLKLWLDGQSPDYDKIPKDQRAAEILAFAMRTTAGWDFDSFKNRTGFDPIALRGPQLEKLAAQKLITLTPASARPTPLGLIYNDTILEELI